MADSYSEGLTRRYSTSAFSFRCVYAESLFLKHTLQWTAHLSSPYMGLTVRSRVFSRLLQGRLLKSSTIEVSSFCHLNTFITLESLQSVVDLAVGEYPTMQCALLYFQVWKMIWTFFTHKIDVQLQNNRFISKVMTHSYAISWGHVTTILLFIVI